ncbi:MAG: hypothetical protein GX327_09240 [Epulopiscium sp.]|mgnify:CR=1 FL=1|jgi:hypothetical protein|nr:hypothetical protein [Candidatus Epulonipiscium sp.]
MKVIMKNIDVIAWFEQTKGPIPLKFRIKNKDESQTIIKIDKICFQKKEKLAGNPMIIFTCQSLINNVLTKYEIRYEINTCKWYLYKI